MMKCHVPFRRLVTLETSFTSFWCQEVNGRRLFKEMTESTLAFSAEQKNYREITALGGMFREHRAPIHSLMLQWPKNDPLLPKVVPASCLPRRICDPQSHAPSPHPHNHPHCVSKWRFPPTCLYPQLSIIGFQLCSLRRTSPSSSYSSSVPPHLSTPPWNYFYLAYFPPSLYIKLYIIYMFFPATIPNIPLLSPLFLSPQPWCYSVFI